MKHVSRLLALLAFAMALMSCMVQQAWAADGSLATVGGGGFQPQAGEIASGVSGSCNWVIDADGTLVISPTNGTYGELEDTVMWPWGNNKGSIKSVRFEGQVKAVNCASMFEGCSKLASVDFTNLDTSSNDTTYAMFADCDSLVSVDLSGFDTSKVYNMGLMFLRCDSLASVTMAGCDTSQVLYFSSMFWGCPSLKSVDFSGWDTSKAGAIGGMFADCSSLESLDLSGWDLSGVYNAGDMFKNCTSLRKLKFGSKVNGKVMGQMPSYVVNGHKDWYSNTAKAWFTSAQIASSRIGIADTYTKDGPAVSRSNNPMTAKAKTIKAKAAKKTVVKASKAFKVKNARGPVTYKKMSGNKKIKIASTGKVTVKKGLKKGKTYKAKVKISAEGDSKYKPVSKTVTLKVKVK